MAFAVFCTAASGAQIPAAAEFQKDVQPILKEFCYDCHGDGAKKGEVAFDELTSDDTLLNGTLLGRLGDWKVFARIVLPTANVNVKDNYQKTTSCAKCGRISGDSLTRAFEPT